MIDINSTGSEANAPGGKRPWRQRGVLGVVCALVIGVYGYTAHSGAVLPTSLQAATSYYNLLVQGFRAGQLSLRKEVPLGLAQLADPYDPAANAPYRVFDLSYYKGKLYLYSGITPALVLFWPYAALTGQFLSQRDAGVFFCVVGFLVSVSVLCALWRRYFAEVSAAVVATATLTLGLATFTPLLLARCDVYEVCISCGYALTMLALAGIWKALHEPERQGRWLAAASLAYGLAVGARPSLLFGAVILLVPVAQAWRERRKVGVLLMAAIGPIALIGLGLMLYNALRFDNPSEFGWHYVLGAQRQNTIHPFGLRYLWFNFRVYFLEPAHWSSRFPFIQDITVPHLPVGHAGVEHPFGVLTNIPLVWLALAVPLAWRGRSADARSILSGFLAAVAVLFGICALTIGLFFGVCIRYEVEFLPALMLLAVIGILSLEHALTCQPLWRRTVRWGWSLLLGFSVAFNLLASVEQCAEAHSNLGFDLEREGKIEDAISQYEQAIRINPNSAMARFRLGIALVEIGKPEDAVRQYEAALRLDPKLDGAHNNMGMALLQIGRAQEAIDHFQQAVRIYPAFAEAHNNLGLALAQTGRRQDAIRQYEQAIQIQPDFSEAHYNLGNAYLQLGDPGNAVPEYEQAIRIRPDNADAHNNLGLALAQLGAMQRAIAHYQQALRIKPDFAAAQYNLRSALERTGKLQEAVIH
jgi:tetratricopeptide (TPR) repeat protein